MHRVEFAPEYPRDEHGWVEFPSDVKLRRDLFVPESMKHPAKANLYLVQECVRVVSAPGQKVVDIFGGSGSLLIALTMGRRVEMVELNPQYCQLIRDNARKLLSAQERGGSWAVHEGPCQEVLRDGLGDVQAIITSPPYAQMLHGGVGKMLNKDYESDYQQYIHGERVKPNGAPYNLGRMTNFLYTQEMADIYRLSYEVLNPGGWFVLIIKDRIKAGVREELGFASVQRLTQVGFRMVLWARWRPPGTQFVQIHKKRGNVMVEDEHVVFMQKGAS